MARSSKVPKLADVISGNIRALILEGSLQPGDRIPSERQLTDQFEASRPTIRDALKKLEDEGLLQMRRGGLYVADAIEDAIRNPLTALLKSDSRAFDDYLEFRGVIEGAASAFAAERATAIDKETLRASFAQVLACHDANVPVEEARADASFHVAIYEACHNLTILHVMRGMSDLLRNDVFYNRATLYAKIGYRESTVDQHRAIFEAIIASDADTARHASETHILYVRRALEELTKAESRFETSTRRANALWINR